MPSVEHVQSRDGTRVAYRASGTGEPLLLVHGGGTTSADWILVASHLRDRFRVVTMDRRGRGGSGDGPDHSLDREAEDVAAVVDAVGASLLVGHSYGALCCISAAERLAGLERLVIYEPPLAIRERHLDGLDERVADGDHDALLQAFLRAVGCPEEQLRAIRSSPAWPVLLGAVPALPRELRAAAAWSPPRRPLEVPTLLLLGGDTDDAIYLDGLDELTAAFTDLRQERIPGQRHIGHVFAAPVFTELVAGFCGEPLGATPARPGTAGRSA